jgi:steroid delta-isomerase-like uncharacterized protein
MRRIDLILVFLVIAAPLAARHLEAADQRSSQSPTASAADSFMQAWHERDAELLSTLFAPDAEYVTPSGVYEGPEGAAQYLANTFVGAPESTVTPGNRVVGAAGAALQWVMTGTHTGTWPGLPATGREFRLPGVTVLEIQDGRIVRATDYYDRFSFLQQLGAIPPSGSGS